MRERNNKRMANLIDLAVSSIIHIERLEILSPQDRYTNLFYNNREYKAYYVNYNPSRKMSNNQEEENSCGMESQQLLSKIAQQYGFVKDVDGKSVIYKRERSGERCCGLFSRYNVIKLNEQQIAERVNAISELAEERKVGACEIQSIKAYKYLVCECNVADCGINVSLIQFKHWDHLALLISKEGKNIICDPWASMCYSEVDLNKRMKFLVDSGSIHPLPFKEEDFSYNEVFDSSVINKDLLTKKVPVISMQKK